MLFRFLAVLVWIVSKYSLLEEILTQLNNHYMSDQVPQSAIMGSANTGKSNLVNRFNKLNLRDIYMIYKDHNEYSMYIYDPKDKDDEIYWIPDCLFPF